MKKNKCSNACPVVNAKRSTTGVLMFQCSNERGFTLIELMVVVAITVIISTMVLANMKIGGRSRDVNSSAEKIAGVLKQAQMMALTGKTMGGARPDYGYGVYFDTSTDPDSYYLFVNDNDGANYQYDSGSDTIIQSFTLSRQVNFKTPPTYTSIIFVPPRKKVYVSNGAGGAELTGAEILLITLTHEDINFSAYVRINSQGEIDVRKTE